MKTLPLKTVNGTIDLPILGLGTWQLTGHLCTESVEKAIVMGYTHIDTAWIYQNQKEEKKHQNQK